MNTTAADATHYDALTRGAGLVDLSDWTQLEMTGDDRGAFLQNLCTNEVRKLTAGTGCEAFITNVQGKMLGHVYVFCGPSSLILVTVPGQAETLLPHLERYHINEKVELADRTETWGQLLLAGEHSGRLLETVCGALPGEARLAHVEVHLAGERLWLRRVDITGPAGFLIAGTTAAIDAAVAALVDAGAVRCDDAAFQATRIERGTPLFGRDITDANLPQEVDRNDLAISFVKGCYLGQETVARIDALGHVNRTLCGLRFAGHDDPATGVECTAGDKVVATVTSATFSPKLGVPLALAYVRRGHNQPGTKLISAAGEAEVVTLPV